MFGPDKNTALLINRFVLVSTNIDFVAQLPKIILIKNMAVTSITRVFGSEEPTATYELSTGMLGLTGCIILQNSCTRISYYYSYLYNFNNA